MEPLRNDVNYLLALGYFNLGEYSESKALAEQLQKTSHAKESEKLIQVIAAQLKKEGLIGVGIVGGAVVAVLLKFNGSEFR
ncbi:hypothetical protein HMI55_003195 [Coelomomyces lativittatus]|nr:hypothetical protein HMI55_003195 [Coelomomyces lativittatus]